MGGYFHNRDREIAPLDHLPVQGVDAHLGGEYLGVALAAEEDNPLIKDAQALDLHGPGAGAVGVESHPVEVAHIHCVEPPVEHHGLHINIGVKQFRFPTLHRLGPAQNLLAGHGGVKPQILDAILIGRHGAFKVNGRRSKGLEDQLQGKGGGPGFLGLAVVGGVDDGVEDGVPPGGTAGGVHLQDGGGAVLPGSGPGALRLFQTAGCLLTAELQLGDLFPHGVHALPVGGQVVLAQLQKLVEPYFLPAGGGELSGEGGQSFLQRRQIRALRWALHRNIP